ncbi:hypothetical protein, partial [Streptomyces sp. SID3343]|uniref:hypothetical protein n=1 Tax=Streptomyces sp. SID3343 TaxID=2690260 RepID=UPI00136878B0
MTNHPDIAEPTDRTRAVDLTKRQAAEPAPVSGPTPESTGLLYVLISWPVRIVAVAVLLPARLAWELLRVVGRGVRAVLWDRMLVPAARTARVVLWDRFLRPSGRGVAAVGRGVRTLLWNWFVLPLGRGLRVAARASVRGLRVVGWAIGRGVRATGRGLRAAGRATARGLRRMGIRAVAGLGLLVRNLVLLPVRLLIVLPLRWLLRAVLRPLGARSLAVLVLLARGTRAVLRMLGHALVVVPWHGLRALFPWMWRGIRGAGHGMGFVLYRVLVVPVRWLALGALRAVLWLGRGVLVVGRWTWRGLVVVGRGGRFALRILVLVPLRVAWHGVVAAGNAVGVALRIAGRGVGVALRITGRVG